MPPLEAQYDPASGAPMMPYVEAMLTMALRALCGRWGIAALAHRKVPRRLTAIVRSQASMSSSWRRRDPPEIPASLTSTSSCPKSATAPSTRAATCCASATSHDLKDALPPAPRISSAVRCPPSIFVSPIATVAPAAAMSRAMARPIPVAPPVRSTTRSFREGISPRLLVVFANTPCCQQLLDLKNSAWKPYRNPSGLSSAELNVRWLCHHRSRDLLAASQTPRIFTTGLRGSHRLHPAGGQGTRRRAKDKVRHRGRMVRRLPGTEEVNDRAR